MTASIVARDPGTGELGVAVFTAWPAVGGIVPFAEPGVGAVATQSFVEISFGPRALEMLAKGAGASRAVEQLIASDPKPTVRQLGVLAADGESAGFTGDGCVAYAEEATGDEFRCQANMMAAEGVPETMAAAFEAAKGELAVRLLASLQAGEAAGGDARGRMSAALLVVPSEGEPWRRSIDLRVRLPRRSPCRALAWSSRSSRLRPLGPRGGAQRGRRRRGGDAGRNGGGRPV